MLESCKTSIITAPCVFLVNFSSSGFLHNGNLILELYRSVVIVTQCLSGGREVDIMVKFAIFLSN